MWLSATSTRDIHGAWTTALAPPYIIFKGATPGEKEAAKEAQRLKDWHAKHKDSKKAPPAPAKKTKKEVAGAGRMVQGLQNIFGVDKKVKFQAAQATSGWMTEAIFLDVVDRLHDLKQFGRRGLLVVDLFAAHRTEAVRQKAKERGYAIAYIPGGCTSKAQPHDVSCNKSFKGKMTELYSKFVIDNGSTNPASRQQLCEWIVEAYRCEAIRVELHNAIYDCVVSALTEEYDEQAVQKHNLEQRATAEGSVEELAKELECCLVVSDSEDEEECDYDHEEEGDDDKYMDCDDEQN